MAINWGYKVQQRAWGIDAFWQTAPTLLSCMPHGIGLLEVKGIKPKNIIISFGCKLQQHQKL
jgi:hypothetical protein